MISCHLQYEIACNLANQSVPWHFQRDIILLKYLEKHCQDGVIATAIIKMICDIVINIHLIIEKPKKKTVMVSKVANDLNYSYAKKAQEV